MKLWYNYLDNRSKAHKVHQPLVTGCQILRLPKVRRKYGYVQASKDLLLFN
jgi:hypothetical protein